MVDQQSKVVLVFMVLLFLLPNITVEQQELLSSRVERLALLQLRSSLGIKASHWPIKSEPCTLWEGIQCVNGHVTGINLSGLTRTRVGSRNPQFSVESLQNLTLLASFNVSNFALPGSIPEWFGLRLASLQVLDLSSCSIVGGIPSTLGNLSRLTKMYLSGNNLSGEIPASLGQLSLLEVLDVSDNSLTGLIPVAFTSLRNLTLLNMSFNMLSGAIPPGIGSLSGLKFLNLSRNRLSSLIPAQLGDLSILVELDLGSNSLAGPLPPDLRGLRNLQRLLIGNNSLSGHLPAELFAASLPLKFVVLSHNAFTGPLPDVLWSTTQIKYLDVSGNNMTGVLPDISFTANSTAAVFNLSQNSFYGSVTQVILRVAFVDLSGNYFEGKVPDNAQSKASAAQNCLQNVSKQRSSGECALFYTDKGLMFDNFGMQEPTEPNLHPGSKKKSHTKLIILATVLGSVGVIILVLVLLVLLIVCARRRSSTNQRGVGPVPVGSSPSPSGMPLSFSHLGNAYTYEVIFKAVGEFKDDNLIRCGHSGDLFRGILEGGTPVVIKRVDLRSVKKETYLSELEFFSKVSHHRLVPLLGHCLENENEKFIVYKYMPNGDLSGSLYKRIRAADDSLQSLDWITRLKIATGAAECLSYLHHECTPPFVHRNVQTSSILLDDKYEVRLGSLSEVCVQEGDNSQNRITRLLRLPQTPEQDSSGIPSTAYDVYCFGKVLLELVTGKLGISASSDATTKDWLEVILPYISVYDKDLVTNIVDPSLIIDEDLLEEVWAMAIVAKSCLNPKPSRRPLMRYILKALENPLKVVREGYDASSRLRATSSRSSWNAALFGSWRQSSLDAASVPTTPFYKVEGGSSFKRSGPIGSQGSGHIFEGAHSSSSRLHSKEIFPEPLDEETVQRGTKD